MIARLKGVLEEKSAERVVVDVQGVGYGVFVPDTVRAKLPEPGGEIILQIHTHVREDHITLYGFMTKLEKDVFELLMTASGVGPKLALTILSSLEASQILTAVAQGNKALFKGITGVGQKTVEKLFVEIREKAEKRLQLEGGDASSPSAGKRVAGAASGAAAWVSDLEPALLALGYREIDVRSILRDISSRTEELKSFDTALRLALAQLSQGKTIRGNA